MIIWTVMPIEQVLEGIDKPPAYEEIECEGIQLQIERLSPTQCRVIRIISTNPMDFCSLIFSQAKYFLLILTSANKQTTAGAEIMKKT